jgi:hypothetical protein
MKKKKACFLKVSLPHVEELLLGEGVPFANLRIFSSELGCARRRPFFNFDDFFGQCKGIAQHLKKKKKGRKRKRKNGSLRA